MRVLLISVIAVMGLGLGGCNLVFKLPTRQGNVIEQKLLDQLKLGMTRQQVTYLMGTPIAASPFRSEQWQYTGYYKSPRGKVSNRLVSLYFEKDRLARMEGLAAEASDPAAPTTKDAKAIFKAQKKEANDDDRAAQPTVPDVITSQPSNNP